MLATSETHWRERVVRRGKEHVLADVRFPVVDSSGSIVAVAGIDIDIGAEAERGRAGRAAAASGDGADAAMEAGAAKTHFLANMSHEAPHAAERDHRLHSHRLAEQRRPPREQVDNLSKVLVSAEHLLALIDEILDLSRIEAGEVTLDISETNVTDVLREVTDSLEPLVDRPRVRLVVDANGELPRSSRTGTSSSRSCSTWSATP